MDAENQPISFILKQIAFFKKKGDPKRLAPYEQKLAEKVAQMLAGNGQDLKVEELAALFHQGKEEILRLQAAFPSGFPASDLLAGMAASIHFQRHEPHKALGVAKCLQDPEQRRLRQKSAEMWPRIFTGASEPLPRVHLIVLTHNREKYVEQALRELGRASYPNYAVYIADNGSTDSTGAIAARARDFFPANVDVHVEQFPTNIGRPAGHNWVLTAHDHSRAEFIAIGDDDLTRVPPDWLQNMVRTAQAFPNAACVGGKALSSMDARYAHGMGRNLVSMDENHIRVSSPNDEEDIGQFDYIDMVDHVTGCLHIYRREALEKSGLFDIRLSPCQWVDVDNHISLALAGYDIIYNGFVAFDHLRGMGNQSQVDRVLAGNAAGNVRKIFYKYDPDELVRAIAARRQRRRAWLGLGQ